MKKINIFTVLAVATIIIGLFAPSFVGNNMETIIKTLLLTSMLEAIFSIGSIIYAKKIEKSKIIGILLLVLSIFCIFIFGILYTFIDLAKSPEKNGELCKQVANCEKKKDGLNNCYLESDTKKLLPIICKDSNLKK